jgi:hypothetical protein
LPALRIRNLISLLLYTVAILVATAVLWSFAQNSVLRQRFFTYRADLGKFGVDASFSPFSIIPTLLSVILALWWASIDNDLRAIQPLLSMLRRPRTASQGVGLTYVSSFWLWASVKASRNQHWLLVIVTITTFLTQIRKSWMSTFV